ncbi:DUF2786 domain-containing protein [Aurantiacibacter xanthus]|uniref:DUF2786 domain-containing protein n=1 Tax=Aurantiacibacter xanthus TaxID=1784712 RepID=A0A3A1P3U3_9SPHN|nr:DUF2786 domain-containing protein [Aurantiacibacter xanthus]RIV82965.1 DUF2786 domain-containing protein [Aurantiacibacter xanthus]
MDKQLLAKIQKCFALAGSSNEYEAAAALAKAKALMDENGISFEMLQMADIEEATSRASRTQRPPVWETYLCAAVQRAFGVVSFINEGGDRTFVGRGVSAEIASYAFAVLFRQLKRARRDYIAAKLSRCKTANKRRRADVYCEAWTLAVYSKIARLAPQLPQDAVIDQYLAERHPQLVGVDSRSAAKTGRAAENDYWNGLASGSQVELHRGVDAEMPPLAIA